MIANCIAVTSGKGGVLKTTVATHLAGLAAHGGWKVLLVDADPQGNCAFDLGFSSDGGVGLAAAIERGAPVRPQRGVRPGLDAVPGGTALDGSVGRLSGDVAEWHRLSEALAPLAVDYDLVVIDAPARELALRRMLLTAARFVVVPTGFDRASRVGLPDTAITINEVRRATNPELDVLAVVGGPLPSTNTRIRERVLARLGDLIDDHELVCRTVVRHAPLVAEQCREHGILSHEYADLVRNGGCPSHEQSQAAEWVADDWARVVRDLLDRFVDARAEDHLYATAGSRVAG